MPPRPLLVKPPTPPATPLPRSKAPSWFELAAQTLGGALGIPPLSAEDYDSPEGGRSIDRAGALGELLTMGLGIGTLGAAIRGPKAAKGSIGAATKRIPNPIKAYHGSPHDFEKFSLSKIGTGEGAQAYGHGLYFAEAEGTAKMYREQLSNGVKTYEGVPLKGQLPWMDGADPTENAKFVLAHYDGNKEKARAALLGRASNYAGGVNQKHADWYTAAAEALDRLDPAKIGKAGKTYEVNIHATPDELLDWDKPLSQQPAKVREAAKAIRIEHNPAHVTGEAIYRRAGATGPNTLRDSLPPGERTPEAVLKQYGIKGIQYLDQGSRAAGDGTRNFVIFDDELIEIARKYGIPLATAAALVKEQGGTVQQR